MIERYEIKVGIAPDGTPDSAVVVTWLESGPYTVRVLSPGPFDTPGDLWARARRSLDIQMRLW